jgi:hypothetical protein
MENRLRHGLTDNRKMEIEWNFEQDDRKIFIR